MWRRHVQRYGDALNANPHFHSIVLDGVYAADSNGRPEFHSLPAPEDEDVLRLTTLVSQRVQSLLERRGLSVDADSQQADPLSQDEPGMAALLASSVRRRIAVGSNTGRGIVRLGDQIDGDSLDAFQGPRCAIVSGFSIHANVYIEERDRLEKLIRYAARPAVATERLSALPDGRLLYRLKRSWRDQRRHFRTARFHGEGDFIMRDFSPRLKTKVFLFPEVLFLGCYCEHEYLERSGVPRGGRDHHAARPTVRD